MDVFVVDKSGKLQVREDKSSQWMEEAFAVAVRGLQLGEVPVGCVFVHQGKIITKAHNMVNHTKNATRHAEMVCIDKVIQDSEGEEKDWRIIFKNTVVTVTVEPCIMCVSALLNLEVFGIIYGCGNDRFGGCGSVVDVPSIQKSVTRIFGGVQSEKAMTLLKTFYKGENPNVPDDIKRKKRKKEPV